MSLEPKGVFVRFIYPRREPSSSLVTLAGLLPSVLAFPLPAMLEGSMISKCCKD